MADPREKDELQAIESIKKLLKAGVELGVAEASRRLASLSRPDTGDAPKDAKGERAGPLSEIVQFVKSDPMALFQLAKEVWSRGGAPEKNKAAEAIGKGLGFFVPHKALDAARELAAMARTPKEAKLVGRKAIEPVLERNPALLDRVKKLLEDNERLLRQAAIAGLVGYIARRRKYAALGVELLLFVAQRNEKEIRAAVRYGMRKMMEVDPKETGKAILAWVRSNPSKERIQTAAALVAARATDVRLAVEKGVFLTLAKYAQNGNGSRARKPAPKRRVTKARPKTKAPAKQG